MYENNEKFRNFGGRAENRKTLLANTNEERGLY
jgi:hypothetical protein